MKVGGSWRRSQGALDIPRWSATIAGATTSGSLALRKLPFVVIDTDGSTAQAAKPCKKCQGREWCGCSYQGKPRISCNPCCYQGPFDPYPVCYD